MPVLAPRATPRRTLRRVRLHGALTPRLNLTAEKGFTPSLPTNKNLIRLLQEHFDLPLHQTYATNLFPFIKPGAMNARIPVGDLTRSAREFAIPQIDIVAPRLVICLGLATYNGLRRALRMPRAKTLDEAIGHPFSHNGTRVWCQAHTGGLGQSLRGPLRVAHDWSAMRMDADRTNGRARGVDAAGGSRHVNPRL